MKWVVAALLVIVLATILVDAEPYSHSQYLGRVWSLADEVMESDLEFVDALADASILRIVRAAVSLYFNKHHSVNDWRSHLDLNFILPRIVRRPVSLYFNKYNVVNDWRSSELSDKSVSLYFNKHNRVNNWRNSEELSDFRFKLKPFNHRDISKGVGLYFNEQRRVNDWRSSVLSDKFGVGLYFNQYNAVNNARSLLSDEKKFDKLFKKIIKRVERFNNERRRNHPRRRISKVTTEADKFWDFFKALKSLSRH
ncbi:hypothetical protein ABK040_006917 [Willaertia magna]